MEWNLIRQAKSQIVKASAGKKVDTLTPNTPLIQLLFT